MISSFLDGISGGTGEKIASDGMARLFGPALLFWGGGILLVEFSSWWHPWAYFFGIDANRQIVLGIVFVLVVILSDIVMEWLTLPLLRLCEGYYWPPKLQSKMVEIWRKRLEKKDERLEELEQLDLTIPALAKEQIQLETTLATYPANWAYLMPTPIGNRLRAAEMHANDRYGLEAITVWPHLWLVLPQETKQELITARQRLEKATQLLAWGILFWGWVYYSWWAPLLCVLTVILACWRINHSTGIYGDLIKAAFDLHRFELYKQMNWPLPQNSEEEKKEGERLTQYIYRGPESLATRQDFKHLST